jgi:hypothetical protein
MITSVSFCESNPKSSGLFVFFVFFVIRKLAFVRACRAVALVKAGRLAIIGELRVEG